VTRDVKSLCLHISVSQQQNAFYTIHYVPRTIYYEPTIPVWVSSDNWFNIKNLHLFIYLFVRFVKFSFKALITSDYELVFDKAIEYVLWSRKLIYRYLLHEIRNSVTVQWIRLWGTGMDKTTWDSRRKSGTRSGFLRVNILVICQLHALLLHQKSKSAKPRNPQIKQCPSGNRKQLKESAFIVCFLLGYSPASEFCVPTFRNTLSVPSS